MSDNTPESPTSDFVRVVAEETLKLIASGQAEPIAAMDTVRIAFLMHGDAGVATTLAYWSLIALASLGMPARSLADGVVPTQLVFQPPDEVDREDLSPVTVLAGQFVGAVAANDIDNIAAICQAAGSRGMEAGTQFILAIVAAAARALRKAAGEDPEVVPQYGFDIEFNATDLPVLTID